MNYKFVLGGVALGLVGALAYLLADDRRSARAAIDLLRREKLIEILKELRRETYSALITLASFAISIKEQNPCRFSDSELRRVLDCQSPLRDQVRRAEQKVYELFETTEVQVQAAFEHYRDDQ
jgi:hypothetical protein